MSQYPPSPIQHRPPYEPDQTQLERRDALHRFNRRYVYLPIGIFVALTSVVIILLFIGVFSPAFPGGAAYASALADITLIMFLIPAIIMMAAGPALLYWLLSNGRRRRWEGKPRFDEGGKLQVWLWQLDTLLGKTRDATAVYTEKASKPIIAFNSWLAYAKAFLEQIKNFLKRS